MGQIVSTSLEMSGNERSKVTCDVEQCERWVRSVHMTVVKGASRVLYQSARRASPVFGTMGMFNFQRSQNLCR